MIASRTRIKICGIRDVPMALHAAHAGADAIGLVFHPGSPRFVDVDRAREIVAALPPFVTAVGLFVNRGAAGVRELLSAVPLGALQFHGDETPEFCEQFGLPWIKAIRVGRETDLVECDIRFAAANAMLLDADVAGHFGGTGTAFDWGLVPRTLGRRIVLSGGLNAGNVAEAIRVVEPWAVDVSSGVESSRGVKDAERVDDFIRSVRNADASRGR